MKKLLQNTLTFVFFATIMVFCGIGIQKTYEFAANLPRNVAVPSRLPSASPNPAPDGRLSAQEVKRPTEAGYFNGAEAPNCDPTARWCPDPTGKACQPQPKIQYRRWR